MWIDRLWPLPALAFVLVVGTGQMIRAAPADDQALVAKGQYLARAGDCIACHTNPGGALFAGGRPMATPFGTLYTSNITPDPTTGIGSWTADDFYRTMHTGRFPDGGLIYPAMPFGSYTKVTRADSDAIFAYLRSVPPVHQANRPTTCGSPSTTANSSWAGARCSFRKANISRTQANRPSGTAAPISWRAWAIALCATRRSTPSAAARSRRHSRAG